MISRCLCNTCLQPFELLVQASDVHLLHQIVDEAGLSPCPRLCGGKMNVFQDHTIDAIREGKQLAPVIKLTAKELYAATLGAGLPDELPTDPLVVASLLKSSPVVDCTLQQSGDRVYLTALILSNGCTVHLAGGMQARVLKITKEKSDGLSPHP